MTDACHRKQPVFCVVIQFNLATFCNHAPPVRVGLGGHPNVVGTILVRYLPSLRLRLSGTTYDRMIVLSLLVINMPCKYGLKRGPQVV